MILNSFSTPRLPSLKQVGGPGEVSGWRQRASKLACSKLFFKSTKTTQNKIKTNKWFSGTLRSFKASLPPDRLSEERRLQRSVCAV